MAFTKVADGSGETYLHAQLNLLVGQGVPVVSFWLGVLYSTFSVSHLVFLPQEVARIMAPIAGGSALIFFCLTLAARRRMFAPSQGHPIAVGMIGLVLLNSIIHMLLTHDVLQSTNIMLALVGAAFFILSTRWFVAVLVGGLTAWVAVLTQLPASETRLHFIFGMLTSVILASIIHYFHYQNMARLEISQAEENRGRQELERFFSLSLDMLAIVGFDGYFKQVNLAFEDILGYTAEELYAKPTNTLLHPADLDASRTRLQKMIGEGRKVDIFESRVRCKDGSFKWITWNAVPLPELQLIYVAGHNITERRRIETDLKERNTELSALNAIILSITSNLEPDKVFQEIVDATQRFIPHIHGATLQVLEGRDQLVTRAWTRNKITPDIITFYAGEGIAGWAVSERTSINVPDVHSDSRFMQGSKKVDFQSLLTMPLLVGDKVVGVLSVEDMEQNAFGPEEERKIKLIAGYAAVAIENARLYNEHAIAEETLKNYTDHLQSVVESRTSELRSAQDKIVAQKGLQQEMDLARQVQTSLLAQEIPQMDGYVFAATAIPARYVGGDFYDFVRKNDVCNVTLADISGKGIPAAMLTSTARTLIRAAMKYESQPALVLSNMQDAIYPDLSHAEMFGTFFAASLDPKTATLTYANAGHTETIWWQHKNQRIERLPATALPIGIIPNNEIVQKEILLCPGDILVFYSDGITETFNPQDELFGVDRLMEIVRKNEDDLAHTLAQRILTEVDGFANGAPLVDDLTLVVLKVTPRVAAFKFQIDMKQFDDPVRFIRRAVNPYGADFAYQVELALSEVITNIAKHAYDEKSGELTGQISLQENGVILDLYDHGKIFDPSDLPEIDFEEAHTSGYGIHIVRQIMNEVDYSPAGEDGANHWRLAKWLTGDNA